MIDHYSKRGKKEKNYGFNLKRYKKLPEVTFSLNEQSTVRYTDVKFRRIQTQRCISALSDFHDRTFLGK